MKVSAKLKFQMNIKGVPTIAFQTQRLDLHPHYSPTIQPQGAM